MHFRNWRAVLALVLAQALVGCAEFEDHPSKKPPLDPHGASIIIYNKSGRIISENQSPAVVPTMRSLHPFRAEDYWIVLSKAGFKSAEIHVSPARRGWMLGPIHFDQPMGLLILDPVSGAAFTLPPELIEQKLTPKQRADVNARRAIAVILLERATPAERAQMKFVVGSA